MAAESRRKSVPVDVRQLVLHEAGYRCANPVCRMPLTLDVHHLEPIADGGSDEAANLVCLCPNCHALHHRLGSIPVSSLRAWKQILISLNEAFDRNSIDLLLVTSMLGGGVSVSSNALQHWAPLLVSGLVRVGTHRTGAASMEGTDVFRLGLSEKGASFIAGWKAGDQQQAIGGRGLDPIRKTEPPPRKTAGARSKRSAEKS